MEGIQNIGYEEMIKQGTALLLELPHGKVKDMIRSLGKAVLIAEDGIAQILTHLNEIFLEDKALNTYGV